MSNWNQAMCESCWIAERTEVDFVAQTITVPRPSLMIDAPLERCAWCNRSTFVGIYVRVDPKTVPYPSDDSSAASPGGAP